MKNKHRIKQGLSLLLAGGLRSQIWALRCPLLPRMPRHAGDSFSGHTKTAEANVLTPNLSQITENLYNDLPDAPTGSYLGSMGLPVATGETKLVSPRGFLTCMTA
ncbi:hypothetical protein NIA69_03025 [Gemmiger formicilis]|nr:hypothetical protein [Gemmiger formicilis]